MWSVKKSPKWRPARTAARSSSATGDGLAVRGNRPASTSASGTGTSAARAKEVDAKSVEVASVSGMGPPYRRGHNSDTTFPYAGWRTVRGQDPAMRSVLRPSVQHSWPASRARPAAAPPPPPRTRPPARPLPRPYRFPRAPDHAPDTKRDVASQCDDAPAPVVTASAMALPIWLVERWAPSPRAAMSAATPASTLAAASDSPRWSSMRATALIVAVGSALP